VESSSHATSQEEKKEKKKAKIAPPFTHKMGKEKKTNL